MILDLIEQIKTKRLNETHFYHISARDPGDSYGLLERHPEYFGQAVQAKEVYAKAS